MAITKSAKLAIKKSERNRVVNVRRARTMKEAVKDVRTSTAAKNIKDAVTKLSDAFKALDKAAKIGVIKKNTANRKKSRLAKAIAKISK
jgi:small subunit ribosomal protein S20